MIIKENELKKLLIFALKPYLNEYGFKIVESSLKIKEKIYLYAFMEFQNHNIYFDVNFDLDYERASLVFKNIDGKVKYKVIELPFIQVFKQFIKIPLLDIQEQQCSYPIILPIENIRISDHQLIIKIRE